MAILKGLAGLGTIRKSFCPLVGQSRLKNNNIAMFIFYQDEAKKNDVLILILA